MDRRLSILIVDDDDGDRRLITRSLKKADAPCDCVEARDLGEAMAACAAGRFDCAVVDYRLPGIDGLAAISALRDLYPHMGLIMSTGHGDEMVATDAKRRGAHDYLQKETLDAESIWRSIEAAVRRPN
jgi:DNA-binding NtrC family response regulator